MRSFRTVILATASAAGLVLAQAGGASAAASRGTDTTHVAPLVSCSGYGCDGQWPDISGCANTAITAEQAAIYDSNAVVVGYIQLRYSTACRTVWGRIISYNPPNGEIAEVMRTSNNANYDCTTSLWSNVLGAYSCYTQMLYDGGVTSWAFGEINDNSSQVYYASTGSY